MQTIAMEFADIESPGDTGFDSPLISEAIASLPTIQEDVIRFLNKINLHAARSDDKYSFFREEEETEDIRDQKCGIASLEHDLQEHLAVAEEQIGRKKIEHGAGQEVSAKAHGSGDANCARWLGACFGEP